MLVALVLIWCQGRVVSQDPRDLDDIIETLAEWLLEDLRNQSPTEGIAGVPPGHLSSRGEAGTHLPEEDQRHGSRKKRTRKRRGGREQ